MDKLNNEIETKINDINKRFRNINSNEFKKKLVLYDNINNHLNEIENILDDYEINNKSELELDEEIDQRISSNLKYKKLIRDIGPLIIYYQLNTT
jgi:hypothetical protein